MRILHKYILADFMKIFLLTLTVLTFVLCIGAVFKILNLLQQGLGSLELYGKFFLYTIPYVMTFTIPVSAMVAALLLFGRLSGDGEVAAMRASGLSIWQIITPVLMASIVLSVLCLWINTNLSPMCYHKQKQLLVEMGMKNPMDLLLEKEYCALGELRVRIGKKIDGTKVRDISVKEMSGPRLLRVVTADDGKIISDTDSNTLRIELYGCLIEEMSGKSESDHLILNANFMDYELDLDKFVKPRSRRRKPKGRGLYDLRHIIHNPAVVYTAEPEDVLAVKRSQSQIEVNKRVSLSMACFAFTLMAIPLGMKTNRRDSHLGLFLCIIMAFLYYFMTIFANSMADKTVLKPDLLIWIPLVIAQVLGFLMLRRIA